MAASRYDEVGYDTYEQSENASTVYDEYDLRTSLALQDQHGHFPPLNRLSRPSYSSPPPTQHHKGGYGRREPNSAPGGLQHPPLSSSCNFGYDDSALRHPHALRPHSISYQAPGSDASSIPGQWSKTVSEQGPRPGQLWPARSSYTQSRHHEIRVPFGDQMAGQNALYAIPSYDDVAMPHLFDVSAPHHSADYSPPTPSEGQARRDQLPGFPNWSRTWYGGHLSADGHAYTLIRPGSGAEGWESVSQSRQSGGPDYLADHGRPCRDSRSAAAAHVKAERIRQLEKQFGKPKISHRGEDAGNGLQDDEKGLAKRRQGEDEEDDLVLGSVTKRGRLITERPKVNAWLRWLIGLTALATFACAIGGALFVATGDDAPQAKGSMPSFVLYIAATVTLAIVVFFYILRPCCCDPIRKELKASAMGADNPLGGMIVPVLSSAQQGLAGRGIFGRKRNKNGLSSQGAPTVNLIVDPRMFGAAQKDRHGRHRKRDECSDSDTDSDDSEASRLPGKLREEHRRRKRCDPAERVKRHRLWELARKNLKIRAAVDALLLVLWIAVAVVVLGIGKAPERCPMGAGNGWCTYYSAAIGCGIVQAVSLLGALYIDYRDLSVSSSFPSSR